MEKPTGALMLSKTCSVQGVLKNGNEDSSVGRTLITRDTLAEAPPVKNMLAGIRWVAVSSEYWLEMMCCTQEKVRTLDEFSYIFSNKGNTLAKGVSPYWTNLLSQLLGTFENILRKSIDARSDCIWQTMKWCMGGWSCCWWSLWLDNSWMSDKDEKKKREKVRTSFKPDASEWAALKVGDKAIAKNKLPFRAPKDNEWNRLGVQPWF